MGKRFHVAPLCTVKSDIVAIDSSVLHGIMKEISPEFDVRNFEFSGENRETYWKNMFDFERLKVSKQKLFPGMIKSDGVAIFVDYKCLKVDRPVPSPASPATKHEHIYEADPVMQEVQENDNVVGADPGDTNIMTIAAPKRAEDGTDGSLRQKTCVF